MDLKKFYDSIDVNLLVNFIEKQLINYYKNKDSFSEGEINGFIEVIKQQFNFNYDKSLENEKIIDKISGLPQGLAASGFLSNIYLMEFDENLGNNKNKSLNLIKNSNGLEVIEESANSQSLIIRDYCRYVDDIRLVIEIDKDLKTEDIKNTVLKIMIYFLENSINKFTKPENKLDLNQDKFDMIDYQYYYRKPISQILNSHRNLLSGTPTIEDISNNIESLKSLFMSSLYKSENESTNRLALSTINAEQWDIKDSTLKKFIATEFKKNLDIKSEVLTTQFENDISLNSEYKINELEKQNISKILLSAWSKDPSLIYLLKIGLELCPSKFNLNSILESLEMKLFPEKNNLRQLREQKVAFFTIGQIYNFGLDLIFKNKSCSKNLSKYNCLKETLVTFMDKLIKLYNQKIIDLPFYVTQYLILFSLTTGKNISYSIDIPNDEDRLKSYLLVERLSANYEIDINTDSVNNIVCLALLKNQLTFGHFPFKNWLKNILNIINNEELKKNLIDKLYQEDNSLFRAVLSNDCEEDVKRYSELIDPYKSYLSLYKRSIVSLIDNKPISLMKIILSKKNPFNQENALLLLAQQMFSKGIDELKNLSLLDIDITCSNWAEIQNPNYYNEGFLEVNFNKLNRKNNHLMFRPFWLDEENNRNKKHLNHQKSLEFYQGLYNLGLVLRCCILEDFHHTSNRNTLEPSKNKNYGFKTTYFSRSFGLDNSIQQLSNKSQAITPWMSEFIFYCLRWPYAHFTIEMELKYNNIAKLINDRIKYQKGIYGKLTNLPMYVFPINLSEHNTSSSIKVGIVQNILPKPLDLDIKNPLYWSKENRAFQRTHIINICNLIERHLMAYNTTHQEQHLDLLVFPEISVHKDDVDILRRLVYKTKTNIFAGLMFMENPRNSNEIINQALWMLYTKEEDKVNVLELYQGKANMTSNEKKMGIKGYRPYQLIIEFNQPNNGNTWKVSGSICYDSTDLKLAADLRDVTDAFVISAYNKDIQTFDNMASSLSYHMYQPIILSNIGIFGGSTIQAPFSGHNKLIAHLHGNNQIGIGIFEIDMNEFKSIEKAPPKKQTKTPPAGFKGRNHN